MAPAECTEFLRHLHDNVMMPGDMLLVGVDMCQDVHKVMAAYTGASRGWRKYIANGLRNTGMILGGDASSLFGNPSKWEYVTRWDADGPKHMVCVRSGVLVIIWLADKDEIRDLRDATFNPKFRTRCFPVLTGQNPNSALL